ncbi:MAG: shikimate dehydrogenase [Spirochaetaceae bacterium]|nr:MAG: shikimate dehydrogenase [Spirochaetaceae bacterium]
MIALTTTADSVSTIVADIASQLRWIDAVEFRIDLLSANERANLERLPSLCRSAAGGKAVATIATVRRRGDGGAFDGSEPERIALLARAAGAGFDYIDVEADLSPADTVRGVLDAAARGATTAIRSFHDFDGVPGDLVERMRSVSASGPCVTKAAVTPRTTADLCRIVQAADELSGSPKIVIGMGPHGFPTRVLPARLGNTFTFCSIPGSSAAPGHISPQEMHDRYRASQQRAGWPIFAVIGDPIGHSRSPEYHNARFIEDEVPAVYVPVLVDDVDDWFDLASRLGVFGFSVTIPHKESVLARLGEAADEDARGAGACNTVVRDAAGWIGTNTDTVGFLAPLDEVWRADLAGVRVLVAGAGGAARGVVYALARRGCSVYVWNRTADRAERLVHDLHPHVPDGSVAAVSGEQARSVAASIGIVVNATSVGMHGEGDPLDWYSFTGREVVYDIVYTPPETPVIERAAARGCRVVTGDRMFAAQAAAQYELYRALAARA